ncbi:hypothetical protein NEOKW01_0069 [Nematocida sp. AWRm80]|nr:hypothetical protein NEOKW01_0069 [Nematocida sp. AWRm80]
MQEQAVGPLEKDLMRVPEGIASWLEEAYNTNSFMTIEHDMVYSKEYLSNIKFNYIEVLHKYIFLHKLNNLNVPVTRRKEELKSIKGEVFTITNRIADLSSSIYQEYRRNIEEYNRYSSKAQEYEEILMNIDKLKYKLGVYTKYSKLVNKIEQYNQSNQEIYQRIGQLTKYNNEEIQESIRAIRSKRIEIESKHSCISGNSIYYVYKYNKYIYSILHSIIGVKIVDVRYNGTGILIKLLSNGSVIDIEYNNGELVGREGELYEYCKHVNSTKLYILESIKQKEQSAKG